jgi:transporter family-2 protein
METLFIAAALLAGGLLALQAGANAQLAEAVGSPFGATTIQLSVGTFLLVLAAALTGGLVALASLPRVPWWHVLGGTASVFYVISTILLFPRLGAVVSVGLFIAGQMLASLALDGFGLLGVPMAGLTTSAFLGTLAVLSGAALIVFGQKGGTDNLSTSKLGWIVLALLAGAVLPVQGAVNGLLRQDLGAPFAAAPYHFSWLRSPWQERCRLRWPSTSPDRSSPASQACPGGAASGASRERSTSPPCSRRFP